MTLFDSYVIRETEIIGFLLLSYAITQVFGPMDGVVCAVIEGWKAPFESSQITVIDCVVHAVFIAASHKAARQHSPTCEGCCRMVPAPALNLFKAVNSPSGSSTPGRTEAGSVVGCWVRHLHLISPRPLLLSLKSLIRAAWARSYLERLCWLKVLTKKATRHRSIVDIACNASS